MDGEDDVSHTGEDVLGSIDKKREAKGICLKIEGQDGYVFKSYSMNPRETMAIKSSISSTLDKDLPPSVHVCSQGKTEKDPVSQSLSSKWLGISTDENAEKENYEIANEPNEHIKEESRETNDLEDETQDFEKLEFGPFLTRDGDDYSNLLNGYTSTLYDVAMDAVTQSLLASMRSQTNSRKKSPAWNHFCISPRDNTKAICLYCMKEFSRGKNEKDLSTSCLMRHVRRAHPTMLYQDGADASAHTLSSLASSLIPPSPNSPKNGDVNNVTYPGSKNTSPSTSSAENSDLSSKEALPKVEPKPEPVCSTLAPSHSCENNLEDMSDGSTERLPCNPKSASSRRRSAVWKHFYLSPLDSSKAVCIHCMNEFSRGKNGKDLGTSCLIRHMWRAHKEVVIEENGLGNHIPPPYTNPPSLLSRTPIHDPLDVKKESPLPSSPETISDEVSQAAVESMDIKEESDEAMLLSEQEPSLNLLFSGPEEDTPVTSSPCDLSEAPNLNQNHAIFQQNKKIMKRVKSEVWQHFLVSPVDQLKALCRYCPCVISRGKRGDFGTSCLMRHLMRRHPDVLQNQKNTDKEPSPQPYVDMTPDTVSTKETESPASEKKPQTGISKKTSKLWNHFSISPTDPTKVICLHCSRTISRGKKTTNLGTSCLFRHMQRFHRQFLESNNTISGDVPSAEICVKQELVDMSVYDAKQSHERFDEHHPVAKKITKLIAEMIALDLQPSSMVENAGLNRLLEYLQPQYCLPTSSYFTSTAIPDMYAKVKDVVLTHLKEAEGGVIHFTTSIWVSSQTKEYLTLTAHWATYESSVRPQGQDFHCSALLSVSNIDCDQDMHDIPKQLEYLWDSWIVSSGLKKGFTVTDNASIRNNLEDHGHVTVQCFGHTIDLIVSEAIKSQRMVQNLLSIARKICERVHRSAKVKEKLAELQRDHHLPENQLVQDIPSKWRTSLLMLERLLEQKTAIDEMSIECNFREIISCDQWEVIQSVCHTLKPFDVAYQEISSRTATLGQVIPLIHILNRKIDLLFDETVGIDTMLKSLKEAMVSRISATLHDPRFTWATMLDPRYKTSLFTEEDAEQCKQDLIQELYLFSSTSAEKSSLPNSCNKALAPDGTAISRKDNIWSLMADLRQKVKQEKPKSSELAVLEYFEEDILDQSCDPLDYWNLKKFLWPELAKVAARYVGCPPSIVPAESLFSTAGGNCARSHPRPSLENMEGLLFLKVNLPLIYFQY
ncbi:zinc finger BED domain-containing protein 4 [Nerophis ophidion]|uniref:zinc finger BED domain-containing protein 4 n=1 Tax=Nerophis ophidion TaxID=159077 RepID=UPI002ADFB8AE|nr:zinc finger BED domain-containing protein 4 [Nerophis ophidion]XP_061770476.1 zinc finger BED domain-containing protein 4 [Nerophis ophidion]